jgi:hypothetical protein
MNIIMCTNNGYSRIHAAYMYVARTFKIIKIKESGTIKEVSE